MAFSRSVVSIALVSLLVGPTAASSASAAPAPSTRESVPAAPGAGDVTRVVVISIDGLNPDAITQLGAAGTPALHRMIAQGASTLNARSEVEMTITLPNHTGMVTSRRIDAATGGHGVTWNDDRLVPRTVAAAAGHRVDSVFSSLKAAGLDSAMFAAKTKFSLFARSWPRSLARSVIDENNARLVKTTRGDLSSRWRALTFLHISLPDVAGHAYGWLSPAYLAAVRRSDALVGKVLATVTKTAKSRKHTMVVLTADHGGTGIDHSDATNYANYRIPFLVWGAGVAADTDLYDLNATYADPGTRRVDYDAARQPVRNGDVGNLVLDVLGLPPIPGSELDHAQDLEVSAP